MEYLKDGHIMTLWTHHTSRKLASATVFWTRRRMHCNWILDRWRLCTVRSSHCTTLLMVKRISDSQSAGHTTNWSCFAALAWHSVCCLVPGCDFAGRSIPAAARPTNHEHIPDSPKIRSTHNEAWKLLNYTSHVTFIQQTAIKHAPRT